MNVVVREAADHVVVRPEGRLYFDTLDPLRDALLVLATGERPRIVVDLSGADRCDSSALSLLVQAHRMAARHGGWLRLAAPPPAVRRALDITNLGRLLAVHDSVETAVTG